MPNAPSDATKVTINSVGDTGFRIDRTAGNQGATPLIAKVDDTVVGTADYGYATRVIARAGRIKLLIVCVLPANSVNEGSPRPFARRVNGEGLISGTYRGGAQAQILLDVEIDAGSTYELRCDSDGKSTARAWLSKEKT